MMKTMAGRRVRVGIVLWQLTGSVEERGDRDRNADEDEDEDELWFIVWRQECAGVILTLLYVVRWFDSLPRIGCLGPRPSNNNL